MNNRLQRIFVCLVLGVAFIVPATADEAVPSALKPSEVRVAVLDGMAPADAWDSDKANWQTCRGQSGETAWECDLSPRYPLRIKYESTLQTTAQMSLIKQTITLEPLSPIEKDVALSVVLPLTISDGAKVLVPRQGGIGEEVALAKRQHWTWPLDGAARPIAGPQQHLAIPVVSVALPDPAHNVTLIADPFFASSFAIQGGKASIDCVYLGTQVPLKMPVTRTYWTAVHPAGWDGVMAAWYATALADVPEGPQWLHDIAWQHYDYLSHGGRGWFEDIDAAEKIVGPDERGKVLFALHGWYDLLGRYTFDAKSGKLDDSWTAFPNASAVRDKGFDVSESVAMTKEEVHRRIRYAKDRGFRVCMYFADGMTACEGAGVYAENKRLVWGGWQGPDTLGRSYSQNPANPEVFDWYVAYIKALLAEYGNELDALVWDETFMIRAGALAPDNAPEKAYLCAPFMRLVKELTRITTEFRPDLAFLVSDCIGMTPDQGKSFWTDVPPYAIAAHGCYQDSHSRPEVWPYGLFPNLRNTLWSCNWAAVTNFAFTRFGVEHYNTPVATSNGWLDSKGIARLSEAERQAVVDLWIARKGKRQELHFLSGPAPELEPLAQAK